MLNLKLTDSGVRSGDAQFTGAQGQGQSPELCEGEEMSLEWFKRRKYRHFDFPVCEVFATKVMSPNFVALHTFLPLIHYTKKETRYKKVSGSKKKEITHKNRPIKYASHRDACVFSFYAHLLEKKLEDQYNFENLSENVIAYRAIGKSNYDFASEVFRFAKSNKPVSILAFDVSSFFDSLDHNLIKNRLKRILNVKSLPDDWMRIYKNITSFHFVDREELKSNAVFGARMEEKRHNRIASVEELKAAGIKFHPNPEIEKGKRRGIPQGTPISAVISNLYMLDFDVKMKEYCDSINAMYRRYSDDILVVCSPAHATSAEAKVLSLIEAEKLEISPLKTERTEFGGHLATGASRAAQYLGFRLCQTGASIRESSLSRQWRKMRRTIRRTEKIARNQISAGKAHKVFTKRLIRRFQLLKVQNTKGVRTIRNFSSYARHSADAFGAHEKINDQIKRFEKKALQEIRSLNNIKSL